MTKWSRFVLAAAALVLAITGMALGKSNALDPVPAVSTLPPATLGAFDLAGILAQASPDVVVVALDSARHPLRGAVPATLFGRDDGEFTEHAPKTRSIVLVALDPVRADRIARRLMAEGRSVRVLQGGVETWDRAMDADPPAPGPGANGASWRRYRSELALRRAFGDARGATAIPSASPIAPTPAPGGAPPKKREGC